MKQILLIFTCVALSTITIFASQNYKDICGEFTAHELLHTMITTNDMNTQKAEKIIKECRYDEFDNCALFSKALIQNRQDLIPLILELETKITDKNDNHRLQLDKRCSITPFIKNSKTHPDPVGMAQLLYSKGFRPFDYDCPKGLVFGSIHKRGCDAFKQLIEKEKMQQEKANQLAVQQRHNAIIAQLKKIE